MAKIPLTQENLNSIYAAFAHFFPEGSSAVDSSFASGNLDWDDLSDFITDIEDTSEVEIDAGDRRTVKAAQIGIEKKFTSEQKAEKEKAESELAAKELREGKQAEEAATKHKETVENAKRNVEAGIKRQQELHDKLVAQQKKIYAKVEQGKSPQVDTAKKQYLEGLKVQAKTDPKQLTRDIAAQVKAQISPSLAGQISEEDINFIAEKTALDTVKGLANPVARFNQNVQTAILYKLGADTSTVPKIIGKDSTGTFQQAANELAFFNNATETSRSYMASVDKDLAFEAFGDPGAMKVSFYNRPVRGFTNTISPDQLSSGYTNLLQNQSAFFSNLEGLGQAEAKNFLMGQARSWLDGQVARMSPEIAGVYNNVFVQDALRFMGLGKAVPLGETGFGGILLKIPGASSFFEGAGNILGIDFIGGAGGAATTVATEAATTVGAEAITTGVGIAAGEAAGAATGAAVGAAAGAGAGAAAGTAAGAAAGTVVPGIGNIIGAAVGFVAGVVGPGVISWLSDKYNKNKEMVVAIPVAGIVTLFGGPLAGFASGVGTYGLASYLNGGFPPGVSNIITNTVAFFKSLTGVFLGEIATPIIAAMIGLPIIVAFILFIINSGAYVVPLSPLNGPGSFSSPFMDVEKTANTEGSLQNTALPKTVKYTVTIKAKRGALTHIKITDSCQVVSKTQNGCPGVSLPTPPDTIVPGAPYSFDYTTAYTSGFSDSVIINSINVTADSVEQKAINLTSSFSLTFGTPPISCPLIGGHVATPSLNFSFSSNNTGHGSQAYWKAMGQTPAAYSLPQSSGCHSVSDCSYYGYAYDVFPSGSVDVFAPTVLGKDVTWSCSYAFSNGGGANGYTFHCISTDGNNTLVLTHMNKNAKTGTVKSGGKIGTLYNQGGNTHLHIEFQLNGKYVKPENYFCGGK